MNPQEYPLFRALTVRLSGPNAHIVMQQLKEDDRLFNHLRNADIEAWPTLKTAVEQASAMRDAEDARSAIDGISHG